MVGSRSSSEDIRTEVATSSTLLHHKFMFGMYKMDGTQFFHCCKVCRMKTTHLSNFLSFFVNFFLNHINLASIIRFALSLQKLNDHHKSFRSNRNPSLSHIDKSTPNSTWKNYSRGRVFRRTTWFHWSRWKSDRQREQEGLRTCAERQGRGTRSDPGWASQRWGIWVDRWVEGWESSCLKNGTLVLLVFSQTFLVPRKKNVKELSIIYVTPNSEVLPGQIANTMHFDCCRYHHIQQCKPLKLPTFQVISRALYLKWLSKQNDFLIIVGLFI